MNSSSASRMSVPISSAISATLASSAPNGLLLDREARPLREFDECRAEGGLDLFREPLRFNCAAGFAGNPEFKDETDLVLGVRRGSGIVEGEK